MSSRPRCPDCKVFVSVQSAIKCISDFVWCSCCNSKIHISKLGFDVALVSGTRRAETRSFAVQCETYQNGPKGNSLSNLLLSGKIKIPSQDQKQLSLFGGVL